MTTNPSSLLVLQTGTRASALHHADNQCIKGPVRLLAKAIVHSGGKGADEWLCGIKSMDC